MKKKPIIRFIITLLIATLAMGICLATSCKGKEQTETNASKEITIIFTDSDANPILTQSFQTKGVYLADAMTKLTTNDLVAFELSTGMYGITVNSYTIDGITYGDWKGGEYVMMYTSLSDAKYITVYEGSAIILDGKTYNACGLGASEMPIISGATYVFTVISF